jgi:hypothetical protein
MLIHAQKCRGASLFYEVLARVRHRVFPGFETRQLHNKTTGWSQFPARTQSKDFLIPLSK